MVSVGVPDEEDVKLLVVEAEIEVDGVTLWNALRVPVSDIVGEPDGLADRVLDILDDVAVVEQVRVGMCVGELVAVHDAVCVPEIEIVAVCDGLHVCDPEDSVPERDLVEETLAVPGTEREAERVVDCDGELDKQMLRDALREPVDCVGVAVAVIGSLCVIEAVPVGEGVGVRDEVVEKLSLCDVLTETVDAVHV